MPEHSYEDVPGLRDYLQSLRAYPLLSNEETRALAAQAQAGDRAARTGLAEC